VILGLKLMITIDKQKLKGCQRIIKIIIVEKLTLQTLIDKTQIAQTLLTEFYQNGRKTNGGRNNICTVWSLKTLGKYE